MVSVKVDDDLEDVSDANYYHYYYHLKFEGFEL